MNSGVDHKRLTWKLGSKKWPQINSSFFNKNMSRISRHILFKSESMLFIEIIVQLHEQNCVGFKDTYV